MNVMTIETPDPIVFKKATALLKKLNVKISVVEQDSVAAISKAKDDDDFEKEWSKALQTGVRSEDLVDEVMKRVSYLFDENGENIYLKNKKKR